MKKFIYILLALWTLSSCQDDNTYFDTSMPKDDISFRPIPGGAVMHYKLPSDANILYIRIRYKDSFEKEIIRSGSYACDSLTIVGFNEAQKGIKAQVTLCNSENIESEPVEVSFDTKDSGPISFFDNLEVQAGWNSFVLSYNLMSDANGIANVFYIGEDPVSKQPDTLLINSFVLYKGADTLQYSFKQNRSKYDIVVRTEDFRGYMVKEKVWKNIEPYKMEKLEPETYDFYDPENLSIEDPDYNLGKSFLFDGDVKGEKCYGWPRFDNFSTYLAGPNCLGKPLFIIDMKEEKLPAEIRLYSMLFVRYSFPQGPMSGYNLQPYGKIWTSNYATKLPSNVTVYGSNNMDDESSWEKLVHFEQNRKIENELRWCAHGNDGDDSYFIPTLDALSYADPCYLKLGCPASGKKYRYLKLVVNEVFFSPNGWENATNGENNDKYVTFNELEIFTSKKD